MHLGAMYIIKFIASGYYARQLSHCQLLHSNQLHFMAIQSADVVIVSLILLVPEFNFNVIVSLPFYPAT